MWCGGYGNVNYVNSRVRFPTPAHDFYRRYSTHYFYSTLKHGALLTGRPTRSTLCELSAFCCRMRHIGDPCFFTFFRPLGLFRPPSHTQKKTAPTRKREKTLHARSNESEKKLNLLDNAKHAPSHRFRLHPDLYSTMPPQPSP